MGLWPRCKRRKFVHAVAVRAGFLGEGNDHGVVQRVGGRGAGTHQDHLVEFGVVQHLQHGGVAQQRRQGGDGGFGCDLFRNGFVAQRHVAGTTGPGRQRQPDEIGAHGVQPVRFGIEADHAGGAGLGDPGAELVQRGETVVRTEPVGRRERRQGGGSDLVRRAEGKLALRSGGRGGSRRGSGRGGVIQTEAQQRGAEPLGLQPRRQPGAIEFLHDKLLERLWQRDVFAQDDELRDSRALAACSISRSRRLHGLHRRRGEQHALEVAELTDQLRGRLRPDPRNAGDVVDRVAHQRLRLDELFGGNAEFLHHLGWSDRLLLDRIEHAHAGPDELHQILVGGDDGGAPPLRDGAGIRGDEVVRFPVGQLDGRHTEGTGGLAHQGELRNEFGRRIGTLGLVLVVKAIRKVVRPASKMTAKCVPTWSFSSRASMLVKPNTAFTGVPSGRVIGGRAWKARKMKPEPSIRMRWGALAPASFTPAFLMAAVVAGAGFQHVEARAIGAHDLAVGDAQEHPGMAERAVAAVAGDRALVDVDDFGRVGGGRRGGAVRHGVSFRWRECPQGRAYDNHGGHGFNLDPPLPRSRTTRSAHAAAGRRGDTVGLRGGGDPARPHAAARGAERRRLRHA